MRTVEPQPHRLSVQDVYRMVDAGILDEGDRVELIDGVLVDVSPPGPDHSTAVCWLTQHFAGAVGDLRVRVQDVLLVEGGFVLPDLMVIDPPPRGQHPSSAALVVEVAVSTHAHDGRKSRRYARAGVTEYWIVDLPGRAVTVHSGARADGYALARRYVDGDSIPTTVGAPDVDVTALVGPPQP